MSYYQTTTTTESKFQRFLSFKYLVTPQIMKFIYISGVFLSIFAAFFLFILMIGLRGLRSSEYVITAFIFITFLFIVFNLFWRIFCEYLILFFSIHEMLSSIEKNMAKESITDKVFPVTYTNTCPMCGTQIKPDMIFCPNCGYKLK